MPDLIKHDSYGVLNFNIVTGYLYNDIFIDEYYDAELIDRGYDSTFLLIKVENNFPEIIYKNKDGDEFWGA